MHGLSILGSILQKVGSKRSHGYTLATWSHVDLVDQIYWQQANKELRNNIKDSIDCPKRQLVAKNQSLFLEVIIRVLTWSKQPSRKAFHGCGKSHWNETQSTATSSHNPVKANEVNTVDRLLPGKASLRRNCNAPSFVTKTVMTYRICAAYIALVEASALESQR